MASLFRRATASGVSAGAASWANTDLAKVMATQYSTAVPTTIRSDMNGTLSHSALFSMGFVTQG